MNNLKEKCSAHLTEAGKTYFQHFSGAMKTSGECFLAGTAAMIHAVLPFLFEKTASTTVKKMYERQNKPK